jgi:hypothetical protein
LKPFLKKKHVFAFESGKTNIFIVSILAEKNTFFGKAPFIFGKTRNFIDVDVTAFFHNDFQDEAPALTPINTSHSA